jgi:hypothetical protein
MQQPPPIQEWLVQLMSMLSNLLIGIAAVVGIGSLWQWRKELIGRTKFEAARKLILLALQFRDEFHSARGIFTFGGESSDRKRSDSESEAERGVLDEHYARVKRLQILQQTLRKLHEAGWEAEIILGEKEAKLIEPLEKSFRDLAVEFEFYFQYQYQRAKHPLGLANLNLTLEEQSHRTVYGNSDDAIGKAVDDAITSMKQRLKVHIS